MMWIGEEITEHGVGNGISIVLLINIVSRIPDDFVTLFDQFMKGQTILNAVVAAVVIIAVVLVTVCIRYFSCRMATENSGAVCKENARGRKMVGGQSTNIPLKVNTAGVIPVIFASSLMSFPNVIASLLGKNRRNRNRIQDYDGFEPVQLVRPQQTDLFTWSGAVHCACRILCVIFYTSDHV